MRIDIVTIFPEMFDGVFNFGIVRRAAAAGIVELNVHDLRDWTTDKHRTTDDAPYGGGPGMVMKVEPLVNAVEALVREGVDSGAETSSTVLLTPRGHRLDQRRVSSLTRLDQLVLIAGRYEGVDARFQRITGAEEISIGDYVVSGGEVPAMVLVDAVVRLIPGAISDPASAEQDSFSDGLLDFPSFTRPPAFRGSEVPPVLLSGDHGAIDGWRRREAIRATWDRRPELLAAESTLLGDKDKEYLSLLKLDS